VVTVDLHAFAPVGKALFGAARLSGKLVLVIVPLVTAFELLRHVPFFRRAGDAAAPLVGKVGLSRDATVPLFTGVFLGIAYGAGIIIRVSREKGLPDRELFLTGLFLATCHAVVEDTLIFAAVGGPDIPRLAPVARRGRRLAIPSPRVIELPPGGVNPLPYPRRDTQ
jgi:hypothetical protein